MSNDSMVAVMDQCADLSASGADAGMLSSGLAHAQLPPAAGTSTTDSGVLLTEKAVTGLLMLRATSNADALSTALKSYCGIALSSRLHSDTNGAYCVRWMSPDAWVLSCPLEEVFAIEGALRDAIPGHIAIVNISGGYTILELSGTHARSVLMKSTGYDVHPDHLGQGKVVNTTFAKAQVTLRAVEVDEAQGRYELLVRRSFTDYLWLWLQRAGAEYGLHATSEPK